MPSRSEYRSYKELIAFSLGMHWGCTWCSLASHQL